MYNGIVKVVERAGRLSGQAISAGRLGGLANRLAQGLDATALFRSAWAGAGFPGEPMRIRGATPADLPLAGWSADLGWVLVQGRTADGKWKAERLNGEDVLLDGLDDVECLSMPRRPDITAKAPSAMQLVWAAIYKRKRVFFEAVIATGLVNLLTLGTSLYSMQVYDRVIPSQGFQTLWVLSVGVALTVCFEFLLKQVRSYTVDRTCNVIDHELSEWFFDRMMRIRMEARPPSVGTLASQVKGFEMVRGVLASTSLFVLADVPFALFFLLVIALIGGWVAVVPLIALPIALGAGLMFQAAIQRHTRVNLAANNKKAGLLVEAVDGAESVKANSAEWKLQSRWNQLVLETGESDQKTRSYSALAQNLTVALQQLGYVGLVAVGAYLVTVNELTMGGLLACTIISNRAMMPIVQLPGILVQWAHARAAVEGLDRVIALPNENDQAHHALVPQLLSPNLMFERMRFAYGGAARPALEIERLEIRAGERVGLLGAIGSGKSTLLKLSSGLYRPSEGKVLLGGVDVALLSTASVRETVGYLPQDSRLFSGTLRENLLLGLADPGDAVLLEAAQRTGLMDLIGSQPKGLALEIGEGGRGVSGGQQQLIMLTRTLLAKPSVWVLDEPTGAMDSVSEGRIVNLLREATSSGATLIAATHKMALLPLFDRLIVLQNGRILADGPRDAVLAKLSGRQPAVAQEQAA